MTHAHSVTTGPVRDDLSDFDHDRPSAPSTPDPNQAAGGNDRKKQKMEMLEPEDIAQAIVFVLAQPKRCDIVTLQVRPLKQLI